MIDLVEACRHAEHPTSVSIGGGWRRCEFCLEEFKPKYRKRPPDRPNLVNGYYLSDSDYELVKGLRRARDYAIARAKEDYQDKLKALLDIVKRDQVTNG